MFWGLSLVAAVALTATVSSSKPPSAAAVAPESVRPVHAQANSARITDIGEDEAMPYAKMLQERRSSYFMESQGQLYTADASGLNYWSDPGASPRRQALSSAANVSALSVGAGDEILVGQEDGTVSRWDRTLRENRGIRNLGGGAVLALTSGADYLAVAMHDEVRLVNLVNGKAIKTFPSGKRPRAMAMVRANANMLLTVIRDDDVEIIDADRRRSLGIIPLGARQAVRAGISVEKVDQDPVVWIDFLQGEWMIRREYSVGLSNNGQAPSFEMMSQRLR